MTKTKRVVESTNSITEGIVNMLLNDGYSASRINTTGIYVADLYGPGKGGWRESGSRKGYADISACIKGAAIAIEIKFGKDRQSEDQILFQKEWEKAGGIYIIIKTWMDWIIWYNEYKSSI